MGSRSCKKKHVTISVVLGCYLEEETSQDRKCLLCVSHWKTFRLYDPERFLIYTVVRPMHAVLYHIFPVKLEISLNIPYLSKLFSYK